MATDMPALRRIAASPSAMACCGIIGRAGSAPPGFKEARMNNAVRNYS
jgi:hypothetical protein